MPNKSEWKKAGMKTISHIDVQIDKNTLGTVKKAFSSILENWNNPKIVDTSQVHLSKDDLINIINFLKKYNETNNESLSIPMSFNEWVVYTGYLSITDDSLPNISEDEATLLEDLLDEYYEWDEQGITPTGP